MTTIASAPRLLTLALAAALSLAGAAHAARVRGQASEENLQKVPCPVLRALTNEGLLTPDVHGVVDVRQLDAALTTLGVRAVPRAVLTRVGAAATQILRSARRCIVCA